MREINAIDEAGKPGTAVVRFATDPGATLADLQLATHRRTATVLVDHHAAVWLTASLAAHLVGRPPAYDDIPALDHDAHRGTATIRVDQHAGSTLRLRVGNHSNDTTAVVVLDRAAALQLLVEVAAFIATT